MLDLTLACLLERFSLLLIGLVATGDGRRAATMDERRAARSRLARVAFAAAQARELEDSETKALYEAVEKQAGFGDLQVLRRDTRTNKQLKDTYVHVEI